MNNQFGFNPNKINKTEVLSSKAGLIVKKFEQWIERKGIDINSFDTDESIKKALSENRLLMPSVTDEDIKEALSELKKSKIIPFVEKNIKPILEEIIHLETEHIKLAGVKIVEDKEVLKQLEENKFFIELEGKNIFKNDRELDDVLNKAQSLGKENSMKIIETIEYYNEFADKGLIKGGREEVKKDFQSKEERKELFKKQTESLGAEKTNNLEKNKKIATIVERAVAYGVSDLGWYGDNISIKTTSEFDDVKRGTDEIFEIEKDGDESSFMGLGIDVTYRGLLSEKYKEKFSTLLKSIKNGNKTKIKYFKNHKGDMMKEFAVPKIVLFLNIDDVKDLVHMVKNIDDPKIKEEFKNSPQKFKVMNQMMIQCEILADFAEKHHNYIFRKYIDIVSSIKELAWKNLEIKQMLDSRHDDDVSLHMKYLIKEFEETEEIKN